MQDALSAFRICMMPPALSYQWLVDDTGGSVVKKRTDYIGEYIYENDTLQFIQHEEGRLVPEIDDTFTYQYNLKDHLGNTRLTFTTKPNSITFPATFEIENSTAEEALYNNIAETRVPFNSADANSDGGNEVCRVNATTPTGAGLSLQVSAGDTLDMKVYGYYEGGSGYSNTISLPVFIASLASAFGGLDGGSTQEQAIHDVFDDAYNGGAATMLGTGNDNVPAAYLNYILFDENMVSYQFGYKPISNNANWSHEELLLDDILVTRKGFVYVYLTNESAIGNVYFDDMEVTVKESAVIQEDDYYPFGLTFNSYKRSYSTAQNYLYNGKELQTGLGINWYDYGARMYMPDIGRWGVLDRLSDINPTLTPYRYANNNPLRYIDPDGNFEIDAKTAKKFPRLAQYLQNGIQGIMTNDRVVNALMKWGQFSKKDISDNLEYGKGPNIKVVKNLKGRGVRADGLFVRGFKTLQIDEDLVNKLESAEGVDRDVFLFYVAAVILHEFTHYGDDQSEERMPGEVGSNFEVDAYGKLIEEKTARELIENYLKNQEEDNKNENSQEDQNKGRQLGQLLNNFSNLEQGVYVWDGNDWVKQ